MIDLLYYLTHEQLMSEESNKEIANKKESLKKTTYITQKSQQVIHLSFNNIVLFIYSQIDIDQCVGIFDKVIFVFIDILNLKVDL